MAGTIGIKVADGSFYPITGENSPAKKRLVLTTVHDDQEGVRIDLYRSVSKSMLDAQYIGSLVVEDIRPRLKGEASIEMTISADEDGNIGAEAYDLDAGGGERHMLNVSLRTMDSRSSPDDFPDFDSDARGVRPVRGVLPEVGGRGFPWGAMLVALLLVLLGIAAMWFFILREPGANPLRSIWPATKQSAARPEPPARPVSPEPEIVAAPEPSPAPLQEPPDAPPPVVIRAPDAPPEPAEPAAERERPDASRGSAAAIPPNGAVHRIRRGDTLWDISQAFYRDPLLYPRIAAFNGIANPNRIRVGDEIRIPPLD